MRGPGAPDPFPRALSPRAPRPRQACLDKRYGDQSDTRERAAGDSSGRSMRVQKVVKPCPDPGCKKDICEFLRTAQARGVLQALGAGPCGRRRRLGGVARGLALTQRKFSSLRSSMPLAVAQVNVEMAEIIKSLQRKAEGAPPRLAAAAAARPCRCPAAAALWLP